MKKSAVMTLANALHYKKYLTCSNVLKSNYLVFKFYYNNYDNAR